MNRFKAGDKVKIKDQHSLFYGYNALITTVDKYDKNYPYRCNVLNNKNELVHCSWYPESYLTPINEKNFTISIKKHKRINLKFTL